MMVFADLVHVNGLGSSLCSSMYRLIAACKSTTEWKTPRFNRCLVRVEKEFSTALSQEPDLGVKWKTQRG